MSTQYDPNRFEPQPARPVNDDTRSVPQLLGDMVTELSNLFRKEIQLARAEMGEKASEASSAIPGMAGGAALAFGGLILMLMAAGALVARLLDLPLGWGQLIVGVVAAILGYLLIRGGLSRLKATNLTPHRTAEQLSRDAILGYLLIRGGLSRLKATNLTPHRTAEQLSRDAQAAKEQVT